MVSINHKRQRLNERKKKTNGCEIMKHLFMQKKKKGGKKLFVLGCFHWRLDG